MLPSLAGSNPSNVAMELLQFLRDGKPRTRGKLAELCGIARSTASLRIDELIELGLVEEERDSSYSGGRPTKRVVLVPSSRLILAAEIGATHARATIADLLGRSLSERFRLLEAEDKPTEVMQWLLDSSKDMLIDSGLGTDLAAASISLAAPINFSTGRPVNPPIMPHWRDFDVQGWISQYLDIPVFVDKDVNMMALGAHRGRKSQPDNLLFVKISTGIGVGIISNGMLQRGEQGLAGDIGHVQVSRRAETPCHCGNRGCLEAVASGPAIAAELTRLGTPALTNQDVLNLVKAGNLLAIQLIRQAGRDLGEILATCVSLLNPSLIIIGGSIAGLGDQLLAGVREVVYARSMPLATQQLKIEQADPDDRPAIHGAAALAVDFLINPRG